MRSTSWVGIVIAVLCIMPATASRAGSVTSDSGYGVDPCYKRCSPLLANVTPRKEAVRVYKNCFAYCNHKGLVSCTNGVFVKPDRVCP